MSSNKSKQKENILHRYYFDENNSGGYTLILGVLDDKKPHWCYIDAKSVDDAIKKFEELFDLDWNECNSYEGRSCNCCGRRFTIYGPEGHTDSEYDKYGQVFCYKNGELPYFVDLDGLDNPNAKNKTFTDSPDWGCEASKVKEYNVR